MAVRANTRSRELYEQDLYAWSEMQADLLRRRRFSELDLEHVVEEIKDADGSLYREVRSRVRAIMDHFLGGALGGNRAAGRLGTNDSHPVRRPRPRT